MDVELEQALEIIREGREAKAKKIIHTFNSPEGEIQVLKGRFGPFIKMGKNNWKIPKDLEAENLDEQSSLKIIKENPPTGKRKNPSKGKPKGKSKKTT